MRASSTALWLSAAVLGFATAAPAQDSAAVPASPPERNWEPRSIPPATAPVVVDAPTSPAKPIPDSLAKRVPDSSTAPATHAPERMPPQRSPIPPLESPSASADTTTSSNALAPAPEPQGGPTDTEIDEDKALEIKLKSDPEAARRYRSPRKAFFLSLMIPGAGQVYCGSYVKAGLFAATEIGLGVAWWKVAIVESRNKEREAEKYAAEHWRQQRYEESWARIYSDTVSVTNAMMSASAPNRLSYCDALYGAGSSSPADSACLEAPGARYGLHSGQFSVGGTSSAAAGAWSGDSVQSYWSRNVKDMTSFYDLVGRYDEFASGWEDNSTNVSPSDVQAFYYLVTDNDPSTVPGNLWGTSAMRAHYLSMRSRSDQLARMEKWFLGGMILNHLVAAFDAALQASRMNRSLLELQTSWLDGLGIQGGLAFDATNPALRASLDWSF